ncbi:MAG TPA: glycosyltransferase family 4 protein [Segetibacter sp.]
MKNIKILFVVHDASRTGAPVVLLNFLRWFKKNTEISFHVLILEDGPLKQDFEKFAITFVVPFVYNYSLKNKIRRRLHPELSYDYKISEIVNKLSKNNYSIVFGNTIVTLPCILKFQKLGNAKIICAMHELTHVIEHYFKKDYVLTELQKIDLILAGSNAVKENLLTEFNLPNDKIKVIHAFIETKIDINKSSKQLREELGIKPSELIIGGMGSVGLRKGMDLVVPLAVELKNKHPEVPYKLLWVGGLASNQYFKIFTQDAKKCNVAEQVVFIENTEFPNDYLNLFDVFVLFSREDPFPLVLLTAAYMEKALIAFEKSGGANELINDTSGFLASYLDVSDVAKIISNIYHNPNIVKEKGKVAKQRVINEFTDDIIPVEITKVLNSYL